MPLSEDAASKEEQEVFHQVRKYCFDILQKREFRLKDRVQMVGKLLIAMDGNPLIDIQSIDLTIKHYDKDIEKSLQVVREISSWLIDHDTSLKEYCESIILMYDNHSINEEYVACLNHFEDTFKNHEILFEKMMMNDLFFRGFPQQDFTLSYYDEYITLCALYIFIRYISIHMMKSYDKLENYIDILSRTFRVIAHTRFGKNMMNQLKKLKLTDFDTLGTLIQL